MTLVLACLATLLALPYILAALGSVVRKRQLGRIDNHNPRQQAAQLDSFGQRIYAAQQNAWEAIILFAGTLLLAHLAGLNFQLIQIPALLFLAARLVHPVVYVYGLATLRSLVMGLAWASCIYIVVQAFRLLAT
ncbi:MAPEG family protein [Agarivorans sp. Alg241-V36]|uniref:MAPEG family protein n=1 Tax=Agarivorans sp. Alg241-V36 TaxID=2305992 RepID=UPI0013D773C8|nr:MAPEG family protein [Agarivorans sp. Alg241-V36]